MRNKEVINIYCDESCHLENDESSVMVLGAVWCSKNITAKVARDIKAIKNKYGFNNQFEIKWKKVSKSRQELYNELIEYFFSCDYLSFRAVIIPDKKKLNHEKFCQSHNDFYYKMYFYLLRNILYKDKQYNIYLDIKDTQGQHRIQKLREVLHNAHYCFDRNIIRQIQHIRSDEVAQLQLTDLFIGALSYYHRKIQTNEGKLSVIKTIKELSGHNLDCNTLPSENKFNIFIWEARQWG